MGIIRGGLLVIFAVLFFTGLLFANLLFTINSSLGYDDVKSGLSDIIKKSFGPEFNSTDFLDDGLPALQDHCKNQSFYQVETNLTDFDINISCESVNQGEQAVVDEIVSDFVQGAYYTDYSCSLFDCLKDEKTVFYFVSNEFKDYVKAKSYFLLIALIAIFALIFLLIEDKSNAFILTGILTIVSALPFMKLASWLSFLDDSAYKITQIYFSKSYSIFITVLVIGIVLLVIGIILKFFKIGFKISGFLSKFKKKDEITEEKVSEIVKEEVSKAKARQKAEPLAISSTSRQSKEESKKPQKQDKSKKQDKGKKI